MSGSRYEDIRDWLRDAHALKAKPILIRPLPD